METHRNVQLVQPLAYRPILIAYFHHIFLSHSHVTGTITITNSSVKVTPCPGRTIMISPQRTRRELLSAERFEKEPSAQVQQPRAVDQRRGLSQVTGLQCSLRCAQIANSCSDLWMLLCLSAPMPTMITIKQYLQTRAAASTAVMIECWLR